MRVTYEPVISPKDSPVHRSAAAADNCPTSARFNGKDLVDALSQFMTTEVIISQVSEIALPRDDLRTIIEPSDNGPAQTS